MGGQVSGAPGMSGYYSWEFHVVFGFLKKKPQERRALPRVAIGERARQMVARSSSTKERVVLQMVDLSLQGLRFRGHAVDVILRKGDHVELQFSGTNGQIILAGTVMWSNVSQGHQHYEGGVQFAPCPCASASSCRSLSIRSRGRTARASACHSPGITSASRLAAATNAAARVGSRRGGWHRRGGSGVRRGRRPRPPLPLR